MTTLQDTLTYADGSPVNGQVIVHTGPFQISGVSIAGSAETYEIVDGNMTIPLYPNINAQPIGTYYTAKYELQNGAVYEEYWIVPNLPVVNLGQCRVLFPPTPSVLISATQIMSTGAQPGMILSWNGSHWVPGYVTMLNVTPNTIGLTLSSTPAANLSVGGSPATLGGSLSLNVPDAGPTSRGVVTTGAQGFSGVKTFFAAASFPNGVQIQGSSTINGYVPTTRMVATGYGLTGGGDLSADRTLAVVDRSSVQKIQVDNNNTPVGTQGELNFMPGANISLNIVNDATHNRVNVSITSTAGVPSYSVNGAAVGSRSTLNLIAGSGMTITGVDNAAAGSVDVTFVSTGSGGGGGAVASVFGRTGTVVAQAGDYQAAQVTNAVSTLGSYADPSWITSLAWAKITGAPPLGVQTPWASNIDAAGFNLNNLNQINGTASSSLVLNAFGASISFNIVAAPVATLTPTAFNGPRTVSALAAASGNSPALQVVNSTGSSWQAAMDPGVSGTNYLSFLYNSGLVAVLTPNYRLGIGLAAPAYAVDVIGDVNATGVYRVNGVPLATSVQTPWTQNINAAGFNLNNAGRIGIGTAAPDSRLTLSNNSATLPAVLAGTILHAGGADADNPRIIVDSFGGTSNLTLRSAGGTAAAPTPSAANFALGTFAVFGRGATGYSASARAAIVSTAAETWTDAAQGTYMGFQTTPIGTTAVAERMRIDSTGNVGIGTTAPQYPLDVGGGIHCGSLTLSSALKSASGVGTVVITSTDATGPLQATISLLGAGSPRLAIQCVEQTVAFRPITLNEGGGNVGIGTAVPTHPLQIWAAATAVGANTTSLYIQRATGSSFAGIAISGVVATTPCIYCPIGTDDLAFGSDSGGTSISEKMRITGPGLVGIGTAAPNATLEVLGPNSPSTGSGSLLVSGSTTNSRLAIGYNTTADYAWLQAQHVGTNWMPLLVNPNGGNVGVGTPTALAALHVRQGANINMQIGSMGWLLANSVGFNAANDANNAAIPMAFAGSEFFFNGGNLGIADSAPVTTLAVKGNAHFYPAGTTPDNGYNGNVRITMPTTAGQFINMIHAGQIAWSIGYIPNTQTFAIGTGQPTDANFTAPQFVVTASVQVGIGKPSPAYALDVTGDVNCTGSFRVNGTPISTGGITGIAFQANNTGFGSAATLNLVGAGSTAVSGIITAGTVASYSINSSSDRRLKQNIQPLAGGMPIIEQLMPVRAEWNGLGGKKAGEPIISIIAQELQEVIPEAVYTYRSKLAKDDADYIDLLGFEPMAITSHLILAVQQLQQELKALKQKVN